MTATESRRTVTAEACDPVPWIYSDAPGILMWTWLTEHFIAKITGAEVHDSDVTAISGQRTIRAYSWELADLMRTHQDMPRVLVEGMAASFDDADALIREHVGKCYDVRLGYGRFAGSLAQTFTLATGEVLDTTPLLGTRCTITVLLPGGGSQQVQGDLSLEHYKWRLRDGDQILEITPEHVSSVVNKSEAATRAAKVVHLETYSGIARIYRDERKTGCTGTPGFMVGTVDHAGAPRCPVHEVSLPDDLIR
ncbi:MAG: hypothetical protein RL205_142 [Actinomycetota bacterium]